MKKKIKLTVLFVAAVSIIAFVAWGVCGNELFLVWEKQKIERTAESYLKAEKDGDLKQVYAFLAPSSIYRKTHSYQDFLRDMESASRKISTYRIIDIYRLRDNDNKETFPHVEKFVQVEVDVTFKDTGENSVYNYCFTFLREKGVWYKG